jgi:energy-coupling factor transporter ATP-binding protein EcfA2
MVDARMADGSRFNAIIPPLALDGACVSIRRFGAHPLKLEDLLNYKAFTPEMVMLLEGAIKARLNVVIAGGTGSGKTTLLNTLSSLIPNNERIVTIEVRIETIGQRGSSRRGVAHERYLTHLQDNFGQDRRYERFAGDREAGGCWRMRVDDGKNIGSTLIDAEMHSQFARRRPTTIADRPVAPHQHQVVRRDVDLRHPARGYQDRAVTQTDRHVPVRSGHETTLVETTTDPHDRHSRGLSLHRPPPPPAPARRARWAHASAR